MDRERTLPTCFRHPDRETRLACSACGRPACIECVQPTDVGQKCTDCVARRSDTPTHPAAGAASRSTPFTFAILALCVGIFAVGALLPDVQRVLFVFGAQSNAEVAAGGWYRLLSAAFLHAGLMHILFNMYALYLFGPPLEREVGSVAFGSLYVACALAGGAAFFIGGAGGVAVGASGAIFGLFGAWLAAFWRRRHTAAGQAGLRQLLVLLAINMALPLVVPNIAWEAHLGGALAGFLIVLGWVGLGRDGRPATGLRAAMVPAAVAVVALVVVI